MANDILVKIGANITDFSRKMAESQKALRKFSDDSQLVFDSFKQTGAMVTGAGIALSVGLGSAVKTASDFDTQMSKVKAISGATEEEFTKLRETAKKLGSETAFSASQASEGMEYLALAGWKTNDIIKAMPGLLDLAAAGALDLGTASDIVSDTMSAFGLSAEQAAHASDVFAYAQANANTNVEQMGEAMNYLAPTAKSLGWSLEESSAVIMELANNGLKGSMATQAFGSSLVRLAAPTPKASKLIKKLGLEFFDAQGNMKSMPEVLKELEVGLKGMSDEQKAAAMDVLVGKNAYKQWQILLDAGSDSLANMTDNLRNADGTAADMAETMLDNLGGSIILLKSALEGMAISIGEVLIPYIQKAVEFINKLVDWFNGLSDTTKQIIVIITALAAAFALIAGPLLLLIGFIPQIISGFQAVATVFTFLTGPIGLTVAAIGLLVAAFVIAYNKVEWFRDMVDAAWAWIKDAFFTAISWIKDNVVVPIMTEVANFINEILGKIREFWDKYGDAILNLAKNYFQAVWIFIKGVMGWIKGIFEIVWPIIYGMVKIAWEYIKLYVRNGIDIVMGIINTVMALIQGDWEGAWNSVKATVEKIWSNIKSFFESVDLVQTGKDIIKGLIKGISSMGSAVWEATKGIGSKIKNGFTSFFKIKSPSRLMMSLAKHIPGGAIAGMDSMRNKVEQASDRMAEAMTPDVRSIDMSYATPSGMASNLSAAVAGTVDVNAREEMIAGAIDNLNRKLDSLRIEMNEREMGRFVSDVATESRSSAVRSGGRRRL